jgi:hydrogenase-4 component B
MLAVLLLAVAGALALASFLKAGTVIFLGAPRTAAAARAHEGGPWMRGAMLVLAGACAGLGLAPVLAWPAVARAAGAWPAARLAPAGPPAPLATLGGVNVALAALALAAGAWLWRRVRTRGGRRALTWDCGYAVPTARMQYTGGAMAGIAAGWFSWILQPERVQHRPRGPFPVRASRMERVPETVLERLIGPAGAAVLRLSAAVRRLQHGRVQFYIVYLLGGVAALALLVLLGGRS